MIGQPWFIGLLPIFTLLDMKTVTSPYLRTLLHDSWMSSFSSGTCWNTVFYYMTFCERILVRQMYSRLIITRWTSCTGPFVWDLSVMKGAMRLERNIPQLWRPDTGQPLVWETKNENIMWTKSSKHSYKQNYTYTYIHTWTDMYNHD